MTALKKIISVLIILVLFLHTNYLAVYYTLYEINTEELTSSCCEKKVDDCNAKCYLDKKLNEEGNNAGTGSRTSADSKLKITEYVVTDDTVILYSVIQNQTYTSNNHLNLQDYISEIDHPPQL